MPTSHINEDSKKPFSDETPPVPAVRWGAWKEAYRSNSNSAARSAKTGADSVGGHAGFKRKMCRQARFPRCAALRRGRCRCAHWCFPGQLSQRRDHTCCDRKANRTRSRMPMRASTRICMVVRPHGRAKQFLTSPSRRGCTIQGIHSQVLKSPPILLPAPHLVFLLAPCLTCTTGQAFSFAPAAYPLVRCLQ